MVTTTEVGQLAGECNLWLDTLRSFRNKFGNFKSVLQSMAVNQTQRDVLLEIEHLDNQFHIQLINIHDLKQSVKKHMQKIAYDRETVGHISDDLLARHEYLYDEYQRLETTLHIISREFDRFAKYISVK
jgi:septation ring formation regulator EzrA